MKSKPLTLVCFRCHFSTTGLLLILKAAAESPPSILLYATNSVPKQPTLGDIGDTKSKISTTPSCLDTQIQVELKKALNDPGARDAPYGRVR